MTKWPVNGRDRKTVANVRILLRDNLARAGAASCKRTPRYVGSRADDRALRHVDVRPNDVRTGDSIRCQNDFSSARAYFNAVTRSPSSIRTPLYVIRFPPRNESRSLSPHRGASSPKFTWSRDASRITTTDTDVEILIAPLDRLINRPRDKSRKRYQTCLVRCVRDVLFFSPPGGAPLIRGTH